MKKNYFLAATVGGALIGATLSMLHKDTRQTQLAAVKRAFGGAGTQLSAVKQDPKGRFEELRALYTDNQETIHNLIDDVKDLAESLRK
ncbi:hypothetical protein D3D03_10290 [Exiguobacterium sp. RIT452]|jgi:peptidoglycan hydrolase CwlO-like protein|uniref:YtxH domain-containing protein n=1 Tax=Exiguobacterium undae TaxID=169177 RepID=A0ABX2V7M0_9BACL|nr:MULTISPECIES: hypothetical protein [Exiguobacterium]OAN12929.1 hypothetical protein A3783_11460 [Exiguobacterium undae]RJO99125.1 hypothetical protein D3D03_10290 [Exiguobacterium sp. RIT452]